MDTGIEHGYAGIFGLVFKSNSDQGVAVVVAIPDNPKIYHITHIENLRSIVESGHLLSDERMRLRDKEHQVVGMSQIKNRRMSRQVGCRPGTYVGEYVPFNFCPRSVMLYLLHQGNHPGLNYLGGQRPMIHLAADLHTVIQRAAAERQPWAFTTTNAAAGYADFHDTLADLERIDWAAVGANDFRDRRIKDGKQAEFLVQTSFPWEWVEEIGVFDMEIKRAVTDILLSTRHQPSLHVRREWYFP